MSEIRQNPKAPILGNTLNIKILKLPTLGNTQHDQLVKHVWGKECVQNCHILFTRFRSKKGLPKFHVSENKSKKSEDCLLALAGVVVSVLVFAMAHSSGCETRLVTRSLDLYCLLLLLLHDIPDLCQSWRWLIDDFGCGSNIHHWQH